ncbi:MarR family winged helix-turn-helix transcriptional regulator [Gordonia rubripertincta]|uniref:MarR family transcriptional regulator n=1 Tax=Gordonia rubripertincta TaxID=36822 RepID=A0AAW4G7S8_GORRU|nr:MarR family transcriptional regulator [Gordonia rubripertincta]ASR02914.1 Multiple antibiotic resistance protein MarR [Gordonia rubripertincta]MBM7279206.1 MarR family transcriptional regulator [Gordonia rubripertincta]QMU19998.1 MarR family transcriptional regulator [Gordonia rubripertincta]TSD94966.1 MarR family transcriptional regulator [Gordonia rubripertincta]
MTDERPALGVLMFVAHRSIERRVMARLAAAGADDITLAQSRVVQRLAPEPMRLTDLAEQAGVTKQTAGGIVDQLEAAGYLVRVPDPSDRRARLVTLSDRGVELCEIAAQEVEAIEQEWRDHLGADDFAALEKSLIRLREVTDPYC